MYKAVLEKTILPILTINREGRILFANKGLEVFSGYKANELIDLPLRSLCAPYERNRFIFSNLSNIFEAVEMDIDLRVKSGQSITASITFAPFEYHGSGHLLLVFRDVTKKRVQESQQREMEDRYRKLLEDRNRLETELNRSIKLACLGELAAGIAHEINNPLGIILGFAQDILDEIPDKDPLFESVKIIEQETARCVKVVRNLLDLSRLKPPQITDVNLVHLLKDCLTLLAPKLKKNKIALNCEIPDTRLMMRLDPQQIQQVFINVLINAIQAMPLGGNLHISLNPEHISVSAREANQVIVKITDTGHGIPKDQLNAVFDPFFSTKGSKGTGLGLTVCQRIIEDHCGTIAIESTEGSGTTCTLLLPLN